MPAKKTKVTPPELAARWGISPEKVMHWITTGELRAIDVSLVRGGRPRYLIDEQDIADFERRRTAAPPMPKPSQRRKRQAAGHRYF